MENQEDCSYIPITFDPKLIYGFFRSTICTKYVTPVIQNLSACAMHIDYSESWHAVFRDRMLEVIDLDKKGLTFMSWIFRYECRPCGVCLSNTFHTIRWLLLQTLLNMTGSERSLLMWSKIIWIIITLCRNFRAYTPLRKWMHQTV